MKAKRKMSILPPINKTSSQSWGIKFENSISSFRIFRFAPVKLNIITRITSMGIKISPGRAAGDARALPRNAGKE
jgi:hypothetical protein